MQQSHQQELDRLRADLDRIKMGTTRRETTSHTSPEQIDEIRKLQETVRVLENELNTSKK